MAIEKEVLEESVSNDGEEEQDFDVEDAFDGLTSMEDI